MLTMAIQGHRHQAGWGHPMAVVGGSSGGSGGLGTLCVPTALSSRGTLVLEAALRSALLALERALSEQQRQWGACGLCAPCLFPPCANITSRCPRESQPHYPHCPIPRRLYPSRTQDPHPNTTPCPTWHPTKILPMPGDSTQIFIWMPTSFPRNPIKMIPQDFTQTMLISYRLNLQAFNKTVPRLLKHIPNC